MVLSHASQGSCRHIKVAFALSAYSAYFFGPRPKGCGPLTASTTSHALAHSAYSAYFFPALAGEKGTDRINNFFSHSPTPPGPPTFFRPWPGETPRTPVL